ncbi:MAG: cobalamin B12-binding domain-containing protein [Promethearchaeota archaeon]
MDNSEIIEKLKKAIIDGDIDEAINNTNKAIDNELDYKLILDKGVIEAAEVVGDLYEKEEYFLADMLMTGDAIRATMEILTPLMNNGAKDDPRGTILIGTVEGDIHDIGKSLVISLMQGQNINVIDLGTDVPPAVFLDVAQKTNPQLIGLSGLLTASISKMVETISLLKDNEIKAKIIVGGGIMSEESCKMIGADDFAKDGWEGIKKIKTLIGG